MEKESNHTWLQWSRQSVISWLVKSRATARILHSLKYLMFYLPFPGLPRHSLYTHYFLVMCYNLEKNETVLDFVFIMYGPVML